MESTWTVLPSFSIQKNSEVLLPYLSYFFIICEFSIFFFFILRSSLRFPACRESLIKRAVKIIITAYARNDLTCCTVCRQNTPVSRFGLTDFGKGIHFLKANGGSCAGTAKSNRFDKSAEFFERIVSSKISTSGIPVCKSKFRVAKIQRSK